MSRPPSTHLLGLLGLIGVSACQQEPTYGDALGAGSDEDEGDGGSGGGDEGDLEIEPPDPVWSADEAVAHMEQALSIGLPEAFTPRDHYLAFFDEHADQGTCPDSEQPYHLPGSYESCTTTDGTVFYGHGEYQEDVEEGALASFYLLGDFWLLDTLGQRYDGAGEALYALRPVADGSDTTAIAELTFTGTWEYPGAEGWLGDTVSMALFSYGSWLGGTWVGGLEGSLDLHGTSLFFDELAFDSRQCDDAPVSGGLWLRDQSGYWFALRFEESCTSCGRLVFADEVDLGEVCMEFGEAPAASFEGLLTADGTVDPEAGAGSEGETP